MTHCYYLTTEDLSWEGSDEACVDHEAADGLRLAIIEFEDEQNFLNEFLENEGIVSAWFGAYFLNSEVWLDSQGKEAEGLFLFLYGLNSNYIYHCISRFLK